MSKLHHSASYKTSRPSGPPPKNDINLSISSEQQRLIPFVDETVDPNLEHLVVLDGTVGHDDAVVELVHRMAPLRRLTLVSQLDEGTMPLVEAKHVLKWEQCLT